MKQFYLATALGLCLLAGCSQQSNAASTSPTANETHDAPVRQLNDTVRLDYDRVRGDAYRFIDREAGVVCYTLSDVSISCLPLSQTRLGSPQPTTK